MTADAGPLTAPVASVADAGEARPGLDALTDELAVAHLAGTRNGDVPGLSLSRIDPKVETQRYIDKIMAAKSPHLDAAEQALLLEELQSTCTEEVAVFHAFSRIAGTRDPLLAARLAGERKQMERLAAGLV